MITLNRNWFFKDLLYTKTAQNQENLSQNGKFGNFQDFPKLSQNSDLGLDFFGEKNDFFKLMSLRIFN